MPISGWTVVWVTSFKKNESKDSSHEMSFRGIEGIQLVSGWRSRDGRNGITGEEGGRSVYRVLGLSSDSRVDDCVDTLCCTSRLTGGPTIARRRFIASDRVWLSNSRNVDSFFSLLFRFGNASCTTSSRCVLCKPVFSCSKISAANFSSLLIRMDTVSRVYACCLAQASMWLSFSRTLFLIFHRPSQHTQSSSLDMIFSETPIADRRARFWLRTIAPLVDSLSGKILREWKVPFDNGTWKANLLRDGCGSFWGGSSETSDCAMCLNNPGIYNHTCYWSVCVLQTIIWTWV